MSVATTQSVLDAILAAFRGVDGAGGYTYDLSADQQVRGGRYARPPASAPFVCVWLDQIQDSVGPSMGEYSETALFSMRGWVSASPAHPEDRQVRAHALLDDLRRALRADVTLGGLVLTCELALRVLTEDPVSPEKASAYGQVLGILTIQWTELV